MRWRNEDAHWEFHRAASVGRQTKLRQRVRTRRDTTARERRIYGCHESRWSTNSRASAASESSSAKYGWCYESRVIVAESAGKVCRQRSGCDGGVFLGGPTCLLQDFALCADPVFQRIAWSAIALEIEFVSALRDFFLRGKLFGGGRFALRR